MTKLILFSLVALSISPLAQAFRFSPIYATLTPDSKGKTTTFTIENNQKTKIAVQITMLGREHDIDGKETNVPVKEKFNVFPDQLLMEPGQTKRVRLTWLGKDVPDKELAFRLMAEQLDIEGLQKKTKAKGQIKVLMAYRASIYVEPPKVAPELVVEEAKVEPGKEPALTLTVFNKGGKHQLLLAPELAFNFKDKAGKETSVKLEGKDLEAIAENNVLPGDKRRFTVPWKHPLPEGELKADLKVKSED